MGRHPTYGRGQRLLAGTAVALSTLVLAQAKAVADCAPAAAGTPGSDVIVCTPGMVSFSVANGADANDTLVNDGDTLSAMIGGGDADYIEQRAGSTALGLFGDRLANAFPGTAGAADTILLSGGTLANGILGESGGDTLMMSGGLIDQGRILGGTGADILLFSGGTLFNSLPSDQGLLGELGDDTIALSGGQLTGLVDGGSGADRLWLSGGAMTGDLQGGSGDDSILVDGSATLGGSLLAGDGDDTLDLVQADAIGGRVSGGSGDDVVIARDFFAGALSGLERLEGGAGDDTYVMRQMVGQLGSGFEGFESIILDNAGLDVFDGASAVRVIQSDGGGPVTLALIVGSGLFAAGAGGPGQFTLVGSLGNDNSVLDLEEGAADDLVVITGDYAGSSPAESQLRVDAALDASNRGDLLVIQGSIADVTVQGNVIVDGTTRLVVRDVGTGAGILTGRGPGRGIKVVDVATTGNTDPTDFALIDGPIRAGAVVYDLYLESDDNWYLQSALLAQVFGYAAAPSAAVAMGQDFLPTLRERVGTREQSWTGGAAQSSDGGGLWLRGGGNAHDVGERHGFGYEQEHHFAQAGADLPLLLDPGGGRLVGGLFAQYGSSALEAGGASGSLHAWGGGLSLTWYGAPAAAGLGFYADLVAQAAVYEATLRGGGARGATDGWGFGLGLEAGWSFEIARDLRLIPQAQLSYTRVELDGFTDSDGVAVSYGAAESLEGRAGIAIDSGRLWRSGNIAVEANLLRDFLGGSEATASGIDIGSDFAGTAAELGLGGTVSLLDNVSVYADLDYRIPLSEDGREGVAASLGIRVSW